MVSKTVEFFRSNLAIDFEIFEYSILKMQKSVSLNDLTTQIDCYYFRTLKNRFLLADNVNVLVKLATSSVNDFIAFVLWLASFI